MRKKRTSLSEIGIGHDNVMAVFVIDLLVLAVRFLGSARQYQRLLVVVVVVVVAERQACVLHLG